MPISMAMAIDDGRAARLQDTTLAAMQRARRAATTGRVRRRCRRQPMQSLKILGRRDGPSELMRLISRA